MKILVPAILGLVCSAQAAEWSLKATPATVVIGNYSASSKPVLTVKSGDTVAIETVSGSSAQLRRLTSVGQRTQPAEYHRCRITDPHITHKPRIRDCSTSIYP